MLWTLNQKLGEVLFLGVVKLCLCVERTDPQEIKKDVVKKGSKCRE